MKKENFGGIFFLFLLIGIQLIGLASASSYKIEFNQVVDKIVITEFKDNILVNNYTSLDSLDINGNNQYFVYKITFLENFSNVTLRLNLEKGIIIKNEEIFPGDYRIETNGETISIVWELRDVQKGKVFPMFVVLEDVSKINYSFLWSIPIIIIGSIIMFFRLNKRSKKKSKSNDKNLKTEKEPPKEYPYLLDTEKKVIEELNKANRHELWQKQIQLITGFSKAKVSRLIRNLESRGLIKKIPMGNTNKIKLI